MILGGREEIDTDLPLWGMDFPAMALIEISFTARSFFAVPIGAITG
jgi:hypothetical protein